MKKFLSLILVACICLSAALSLAQQKEPVSNSGNTNQPTDGKLTTEKNPTSTQNTDNQNNNNTKQNGKNDKPLTYQVVKQNSKEVLQQTQNGQVNWSEQYVEAKGSSVIDNERFKIPAQARAMATRGAIVIAQRNLLEIINGVYVTGETRVQDMIATNDYVYSRVDGLIRGAQQVGEAIEKEGMIEVTMRVPLYSSDGLGPIVYEEASNTGQIAGKGKSMAADTTQGGNQTEGIIPEGLVFNFEGKSYDPSMFPVVVDEEGNLLLDLSQFYDPNEGKFPQILQSTQDIFSELGFDKGVEVLDVVNSADGKIMIDGKSSKKFDWGKLTKTIGTISNVFKFVLALF